MTHDPAIRADQDHHSVDAQGGVHHPNTPATGYTGKPILHWVLRRSPSLRRTHFVTVDLPLVGIAIASATCLSNWAGVFPKRPEALQ